MNHPMLKLVPTKAQLPQSNAIAGTLNDLEIVEAGATLPELCLKACLHREQKWR
jgi:hypothetical protein